MRAKRVLADFRTYSRSYMRNPEAVFFSLFFPFLLVLMFGAIYSGGGNSSVPLYVENQDNNSPASLQFISALENTSVLQVTVISNPHQNLTRYLTNNSYECGLVIPAGFAATVAADYQGANETLALTVITNPEDTASGGIVEAAVGAVASEYNDRGHAPILVPDIVPVGQKTYKTIDYVVPGLIGLAILMNPMFSMVTLTSEYKKEKLFKQLSLTPLTKGEWLLSKIMWSWLIAFLSAGILVGTAYAIFGASLIFSPLILPFLLLGPLLFVALGMLIGTLSRKAETAGFIGNLVTFPMMFLSGAFIPISLQPQWLQNIDPIWPLYYVIAGINNVSIYNDAGFYNPTSHSLGALGDLAVVFAMALVVFVAAVSAFRWREE